jgi:hypothetical protein
LLLRIGGRAVQSIDLIKIAAEAEMLRLRVLIARQGRRAAFGMIALVFMLAVLTLAESAGWQVLVLYVAPLYVTLILLGINSSAAGTCWFTAQNASC